VEVLWLPRCKLKDLDGLPALSSLRELYLAFNEVTDISLITMLSSLELLDLERYKVNENYYKEVILIFPPLASNNLSELDQIGYLCLCPSLVSVTLDGNPICTLLAEKEVLIFLVCYLLKINAWQKQETTLKLRLSPIFLLSFNSLGIALLSARLYHSSRFWTTLL
jgi:Leucine-rich repeat (LRR) protein